MPIQFQCTKCQQPIKADEKLVGQLVGCPKCGAQLRVPAPAPHVAQPPSAVPKPDPLIGKQIAHYRIESLLGKGGMGKVYKARNLRLDKSCALKILPPEFANQDASLIERFIREARSAANVEHPNVLPVHNVAKAENNYFIEMQYVDGGTLQGLLCERGRLDPTEAARIVRDVASALEAAHEKGIIHRDIKPSNVMLTKKGQVFVADFGLAKVGMGATALTQSGWIMGTPLYMSPEQCQGKALDHRSDIYSLGVMFYEMLAGNLPYVAEDFAGLVAQHLTAPVPDVRAKAAVPDFLTAIIMKMMAKRPEERYQNCGEIVADLNAYLANPSGAIVVSESALQKAHEARRAAVFGKKKRSALPIVVGIVVVVVIGLAALYFATETQRAQRSEVRGQRSGTETATEGTAKPPSARTQPAPSPAPEQAPPVQPPMVIKPTAPTQDLAKAEGEKRKAEEQKKESVPSAKSADKVAVAPKPEASVESAKAPLPSAVAVPLKPEPRTLTPPVDLVAYYDEVKAVNELIDKYDYESASARANLLKEKYAELIQIKLSNIERIGKLRKRCIERVNSGAAKVSMADVSKRYAFAGDIKSADEQTITATIKKKWSDLSKEEIANFYRKAVDSNNPDDLIGIAAFLIEGSAAGEDLDSGLNMLGKAKGLGADVSAHLKYLDTLKQAAKEYTEAEAKGKALETAERSEVRVQSSGTARTATTETTKAPSTPTQSSALSPQSYDDVYVATAATGEKIPHPLSRKTNTIIVGNQRIKVPEGMVFVAAGPFIMGDDNDPLASPAHKVDVPAFFIGKYEVTNAEYMEFVKASGRSMPEHFVKNGNLIPKGRENHPVTYVSWEDAKAYCDWSGKRLPAEAEWEKAASWDFKKKCKNVYPWGDNMDLDPGRPLANWTARWGYRKGDDPKKWWEGFHKSEKGRELIALGGATTSVGMFKGGMSPYKCYDMAGNVYEWVEDWFNKYPGNTMMSAKDEADCGEKRRVFRGGDWSHDYSPLRCVHRVCGLPGSRPFYVSFRCAADYPWRPTEKVEGEKERRGEGATGRGGETAKEKEESAKSAEKPSSAVPSSPAPRPSSQSFDDVYVTAAATGDKIPHPLSKKTYNLQYMGRTIKVPEGMVYVPAGPFIMGEGTSEHRVYLDAYFIGKYEVTNAEWKAFIEATAFTPLPSHWKGGQIPEGRENHPVVCISWVDAEKYCEWVSKETGREIRLPTEAQWEKAASWDPRKNGKLKYPWGDQWDNKFCNSKWLTMAKCGIYLNDEQDQVQRYIALTKTQKYAEVAKAEGGFDTAAGAFARDRSPYGCYDMAGNVMELCADWYKADYYVKSAKRNPQGPNEEEGDDVSLPVYNNYKGKARVWRGGEWDNDSGVPASRDCRTTKRGYYAQTYRDSRWSFRIVCIPEKK